jgi:hypothetical protein
MGEMRNASKNFGRKIEKKKDHLEDLVVDGRIIVIIIIYIKSGFY